MKQCRDCKEIKPFIEMQRHPGFKDGYNTLCLLCNKARVQAWRKVNRAKHRLQNQKYQKNHKPHLAAKTSRIRAENSQRTPYWANLIEIEKFYQEAARLTQVTGIPHQVDHIVPLRGRFVSGLHVEYNLQVIPALDNLLKGNKFQGY